MNTEIKTAHPFQRTLGPGPYKFVGFFAINLEAGKQGRPYYDQSLVHPNFVAGAGTCAHCGHAILNIFQIQTGNGEVYGVGSDCIAKVEMPARELSKIEELARQHAKAKRSALKTRKGEKARAEIQALILNHTEDLRARAHPSIEGLTLSDYAQWILERSSDGGVVFAQKKIASLLGSK